MATKNAAAKKKPAKKAPGSSRIAALAAASRASASGNVPKAKRDDTDSLLNAAASLIGVSGDNGTESDQARHLSAVSDPAPLDEVPSGELLDEASATEPAQAVAEPVVEPELDSAPSVAEVEPASVGEPELDTAGAEPETGEVHQAGDVDGAERADDVDAGTLTVVPDQGVPAEQLEQLEQLGSDDDHSEEVDVRPVRSGSDQSATVLGRPVRFANQDAGEDSSEDSSEDTVAPAEAPSASTDSAPVPDARDEPAPQPAPVEPPPVPTRKGTAPVDKAPTPDPVVSPAAAEALGDELFLAQKQAELVHIMSSPEFVLDAQHDAVAKLTYDLPRPLIDVLNRWELDQVKATGKRLYRERLIDMALSALPEDPDEIIVQTRALPAWLRYADTEQVGTRVRAEIATNLKVLKQEFKLRREKGIYVRHVYALALFNMLGDYGIQVRDPAEG